MLTALSLITVQPAPARSQDVQPQVVEPQEAISLQRWLNTPDWLELQLQYQAQPMANPTGGRRHGASWMQQISLDVVADTDPWQGHLQLMVFSGNPNWAKEIGAAYALQTDAHPTGLWLTEASVRWKQPGGGLSIKTGVFSLNPGFVTAPVLDAYVHSALNNTLNLSVTGLPINPLSAPGLQLSWRPEPQGRWGEWHLGAFWLDPEDNLARLFGVHFQQPEINGYNQMLQWSFDRLPGAEALQRPIVRGDQQIARQLPAPLFQIGTGYLENSRKGVYNASLASTLTVAAPLPVGLDNRFWLGVSAGSNWTQNPVPLFLSGGWLNQGILPGRPLDVLAFGVGSSWFNPPDSPHKSTETVLELNYSWLVNGNVSFQPVLQLIINPDGSNTAPILAAGLGITLQF